MYIFVNSLDITLVFVYMHCTNTLKKQFENASSQWDFFFFLLYISQIKDTFKIKMNKMML